MRQKKKEKQKAKVSKGKLQNRLHKATAKQIISSMSFSQMEEKIKELSQQGYEYNENFEILLEQNIGLPYNFILFCMLVKKYYE